MPAPPLRRRRVERLSKPSNTPTACQCPKPVTYDDATIKKITQALRALPPDNVLHRTMDDYEDERDELRICLAGGRAATDPSKAGSSQISAR